MTGNGAGTRRMFLTRALAAATMVGVYCLGTIGVSGLVVTSVSTSAAARSRGRRKVRDCVPASRRLTCPRGYKLQPHSRMCCRKVGR